MTRTRTTAVHYSSRELSYIRMHQLKKIEKRKKFIQEVKLFFGMMLLCSLFIFGLDGIRTLFQQRLERQKDVEVGSIILTDYATYASKENPEGQRERYVSFPEFI